MTKYDMIALEKQIKSCKAEIVMIVEWIQNIKEKMQVAESTINHIKEYISEIQKEIDKFAAEKEFFISSIRSLRSMPDMSAKECMAMEYRYIYGWTIQQISQFMKTSNQMVHTYLRKGESKIEALCITEGGACNV